MFCLLDLLKDIIAYTCIKRMTYDNREGFDDLFLGTFLCLLLRKCSMNGDRCCVHLMLRTLRPFIILNIFCQLIYPLNIMIKDSSK